MNCLDSCWHSSYIHVEDKFGGGYIAIVVLIAESLTELIYLAVLAMTWILADIEGEGTCIEF